MNPDGSSDRSKSPAGPQKEDPGSYVIPLGAPNAGKTLDSICGSMRWWMVDKERAGMAWYGEIVEAHNRYEEWLSRQPPELYPVPYESAHGMKIGELENKRRYWAVHADRSSNRWHDSFVRANHRFEQHLAMIRGVGGFPFPFGRYEGVPIRDVLQDDVWYALRPDNGREGWYKAMYEDNKRLLDDKYRLCSPGSELIWFGTRYRGLRLDQVYERKRYIRWCFSPEGRKCKWFHRFEDLIHRLREWREAHPERSRPRRGRKAPDIQNPVGEVLGRGDDSAGSAAEDDDYESDFVVPDEELVDEEEQFDEEKESDAEDSPDSGSNFSNEGGAAGDIARNSDDLMSSETDITPMGRTHKRRPRPNVIVSSDEEDSETEEPERVQPSARELGRRYRVGLSDEEDGATAKGKAPKRVRR